MKQGPTAIAAVFFCILGAIISPALGSYDISLHKTLWQGKENCGICHGSLNASNLNIREAVNSTTALCLTCHGDGTGANTDVRDGLYVSKGDGFGNAFLGTLNGGGFEKIKSATDNIAVTSKHDLDKSIRVPGGSDSSKSMVLTCMSCHDPHSNNNYRWQVASGNIGIASNEVGFEGAGYQPSFTIPKYKVGQSMACIQCHDAYTASYLVSGLGSVPYDAGDSKGLLPRYHHPVGAALNTYTKKVLSTTLPMDQGLGYNPDIAGTDQIQCLTCHRAHGTIAVMRGFAAFTLPTKSSSLLRLNDREVCIDCHKL